MCEEFQFLPQMLSLNGEWHEVLARLYAVFCDDFKNGYPHHRQIRVIYNGIIKADGQGKEQGFWHVISDETRTGVIHYPKARRLPWAKPLMECEERPEVKVWEYDEGTRDKGIRTYIWLEPGDYCVILQRKKACYFWVTAFHVDSEWKKSDLNRKYDERL